MNLFQTFLVHYSINVNQQNHVNFGISTKTKKESLALMFEKVKKMKKRRDSKRGKLAEQEDRMSWRWWHCFVRQCVQPNTKINLLREEKRKEDKRGKTL